MSITWLLIKHLQKRYGDCSRMSINRRVRQGRLPAPSFPFSNHIPAWLESDLDEHDRRVVAAAARTSPAAAPANEPVAEIAPKVASASTRSRRKATKVKTKTRDKAPARSRRVRSHEHDEVRQT
jgi:hypothetical protein